MNFKKLCILPFALMLGTAGCASLGLNTYYLAATAYSYQPYYSPYMVTLNGYETGLGGGGIATVPVTVGPQKVSWKDAKTGEVHTAKNQVVLSKIDLKNKEYIIVHMYPDDTIEITTTVMSPEKTEKGKAWLKELKKLKAAQNK